MSIQPRPRSIRGRDMRTFRARVVATALGLVLLPQILPAQRAELERRIQRQTLPNGLEVIVVPNRGVPLVTIEADVKNGSFTQSPEFEGLSHLYEHMFFKANKAYPEPDAFLSRDAVGFDRAVGESGVRLSGGQRAFLSLARALVSPAQMLFLDEPTGAMDSQTEKLFVERLSQSLTAAQTLIISTHRSALFGICDRLIVLDSGRIVADGPRDQVIAAAGVSQKP